MLKQLLPFILFWLSLANLYSQDCKVFGHIKDDDLGHSIEQVVVKVEGKTLITESDHQGNYVLTIPCDEKCTLQFERIGYEKVAYTVNAMANGSNRYINVSMISNQNTEVVISGSRVFDGGLVREAVSEFNVLPTASGNFESILPSIALGLTASAGGELSSTYNVRGGNYDENLVYINDFEIFRPQLVRSGQQEGLSFANIDLIKDIAFSSGGFESKYGDRMSSVLDIKYKRPEESKITVSAGFLGASVSAEGSKRIGANAHNKFRYLIGARYKTSQYLLNSLDVKGEYVPNFYDIQLYTTYNFTKSLQLAYLGNYNHSTYNFTPSERNTALGLLTYSLKLSSVFEGKEKDRFINGTNGLSLIYVPEHRKNPLYLKLIASRFSSQEEENFDISAYYRLSQVEAGLGAEKEDIGKEIALLGTGTQQSFARNYLYYNIHNIEHKGGIEFVLDTSQHHKSLFLQWGAKYQRESFDDYLNEWERLDSAGYSLPYNNENVGIQYVYKSKNILVNTKTTTYVQSSYTLSHAKHHKIVFAGGIRGGYLALSKETIISPRVSIEYKSLKNSLSPMWRLAWGIYYQPPFYREMRLLDGSLNTDLKSQKSMHFVASMTKPLMWKTMSKKPIQLITEVYYKKLDRLVIFDVDNVRLRYSGNNNASGYAYGWDIRLNGEFVKDAESWVSFSYLRTGEAIDGVQHKRRNIGDTTATLVDYVPRPTERIFAMNMFFQDYLPKNDKFKVNIGISVGSGFPFGIKNNNIEYRNSYRYKLYHRLDIGFSYQVFDEKIRKQKPNHFFNFSKSTWISFEVFNLFNVLNPASYTWVKAIDNRQYAIPNNLSSRRLSLKMRMEF